ncbi:hypothetical protein [Cellulomonas sp. URHE0023]|uniref:hypothetical protein n=1 Tax=Cellulomonas sp. URHE0023 TaxID=1380354 RepID=UPI000483F486|nr:hypothetical protein [Cellulomonas sp. URHE0023]
MRGVPLTRRHRPSAALGALLGLGLVLVAGCSSQPEAEQPTQAAVTPSPTPTVVPVTFAQASTALSDGLLPGRTVERCDELEPGTPEAAALLEEQAAASAEEAAAAGVAPTAPALPQCGESFGDLRATALTGSSTPDLADAQMPTAGGAVQVVQVYELADAAAARAVVDQKATDPEKWAVDGEVPRQQLEGTQYIPRGVISGASVTPVDQGGWSGVALARDEASFQDDGSPATDPFSVADIWLSRDTVVVHVQVVGDVPGAAGPTAADVAERFAAAVV